MAACDANGSDPGDDHSITIKGTAKVGEKLTATAVGDDFYEENFNWIFNDSKEELGGTSFSNIWSKPLVYGLPASTTKEDMVSGEFDSEITILPALASHLVGKYIHVNRKIHVSDGSGFTSRDISAVIGPVAAAD
jgi:hypothetical protein